jgi:hypothetical protein
MLKVLSLCIIVRHLNKVINSRILLAGFITHSLILVLV